MTIPVEQYGNVRPTIEFPDDYSVEKVAEYTATNYQVFANAFKSGDGMEDKEWRGVVDACLAEKLSLTPDQWESMSPQQQWFLKQIKSSRNRK